MSLFLISPQGRILVKEIAVEKKTAGGIILAGESDPENTARVGEVFYNGIVKEGHTNSTYQAGNKVFFGKFAGGTVVHEGEKYISLLETEILAVSNK